MLYLRYRYATLALKLFRGEQAISWFDWHFTPTHSSSDTFATVTGSGLQRAFTPPSPWPWVAHQISCLINATLRPIQTRFRFGSGCFCLSLATPINSPAHSPKGTRSRLTAPKDSPSAPTVCKRTVSGSISLPSPGFFSPFPHGTCPLSVIKSI